jgi:spermidine synthase
MESFPASVKPVQWPAALVRQEGQTSATKCPQHTFMVLFLFFCSGATALIYEVIWSKYLALMFGSTVYAQTVVLAVFMGGLALGNRLIGARADLLKRPLAAYGYIEVAIGLYAFLFATLYRMSDDVFIHTGAQFLDRPLALFSLKAILSVCLLIVPTILMGGTLPLLAAWLQKQSTDAGRQSARFYSTNSLGAVFGSFLAGFLFVQWMGLRSTLEMTALANVLIGMIAVLLSRKVEQPVPTVTADTKPSEELDQKADPLLRRGCMIVALTGATSMGLEVLSARGLSLLFGASLQAFAVVLIAFILGIGIGAAVIASPRFHNWHKETTVSILLLLAALWITLLIVNIESCFEIYRHLRSGLARSSMGYRYQQLFTALISLVVLGVPAGFLGAVLPLWIRLIAANSFHLGQNVGRLLTWNTIGAVVGVLLTGFVLMPKLGLRGAFGVLTSLLSISAIIVLLRERNLRKLLAAGCVLAFTLVAGFSSAESWRAIVSSGVFRLREVEVLMPMGNLVKQAKIIFYEDAPDATVAVSVNIGRTNDLSLRINGKADASTMGDISTQYLLAHIPMAIRPEAKDVFVLGFGSGITAGALLGHPVERAVVAENCEPVLRAAKFFEPWNNGVLTNSRVQIRREDARTVLKLSPQMYDVIISEPSNPWTAGIGSVFSKEFYEVVAKRLKPGGIFCQWFHVYEMHDGIVYLVLRTYGSVFPHFELWDTSSGDILLVGSTEPFAPSDNYQEIFKRESPRMELQRIGITNAAGFLVRQMASQRTAFAIAGDGAVQTDAFPVLEYEAPKAFYIGENAKRLFRYDERTWQMDLAPRDKVAALRDVAAQTLGDIFKVAESANPELRSLIDLRSQNAGNHLSTWQDTPLPCVFRPTNAPPFKPRFSSDVDPMLQELIKATAAMRAGPEEESLRRRTASILDALPPTPANKTLAVDAASAAAAKSLAANDLKAAVYFLQLGAKFDAKADELQYLTRIIQRHPGSEPASEVTAR